MTNIITELLVKRNTTRFAGKASVGELFIGDNAASECIILEDPVRETFSAGVWHWDARSKVQGKTAIPSGRYQLIIDDSTRFQRKMPHIIDVPDFTGIRMHNGGTVDNTDGCPLTGRTMHKDQYGMPYLTGSKDDAFPAFFSKLEAILAMGDCFITFDNGTP